MQAFQYLLRWRKIFDVNIMDNGLGGILFEEVPIRPYTKNYDDHCPPFSWPVEFNIQNWGFLLASQADKPVGAAAIAWNTNCVDMLEGRRNLAVLWDIRISPEERRRGVGKRLFEKAVSWSRERGCVQMKIETQNNNVDACRFYAAMGAELGDIRRFAYSHEPTINNEVQLIWYFTI